MNYFTNLIKTGIYPPIFKDDEWVYAIDFVLIWHWKVLTFAQHNIIATISQFVDCRNLDWQ